MRTRIKGGILALGLLGAALMAPALAQAATLAVTSSTTLTPAFSSSVLNYTTTCPAGSVVITAVSPTGTGVSVDHQTRVGGTQVKTVTLTAGQRFMITVKKGSKTTTHSIRCLPADFPGFEVTGSLPASFPLFGLANIRPMVFHQTPINAYAIVADRNGVPVWWKKAPDNLFNVMGMKGSRIATGLADGPMTVYRPNGTVERRVRPTIGQPDAHEAIPTSRGTYYLGATQQRYHVDLRAIQGGTADGSPLDSVIEEVSATGKSLWSWKSAEHFALSETILPQVFIPLTDVTQGSTPVMDIAHLNSVEDDGHGGLIASFRNTSAVYRINKATHAIDWKFGGTTTSKSLTVLGDDANLVHLGGQHDARLLPDGTLSIADNGSGTTRRARVTRWRINAAAKTATLVEELIDPTIGRSVCCGSARKGSDGSWLVAWGSLSYIRAYNSAQHMVFNLHFFDHGLTYRATPIPTSQVTSATLIAGMDSANPR
ncbi:MAG: hypothetical protein F2799_06030 [Actinobacteria bacterium]|uniref:Unannotated protein n=1 Tax=freshwater metagenome TaxID=449393 RepID=A0A6J7E8E5_9ZZZZ|nr:hypothetical protein [Actinomycetota bacterium]